MSNTSPMVILTGGAGFIGSAMLRKLNDLGITEILVVDNLGSSEKWKNLRKKRFLDYIHKDQFIDYILEDGNFGKVDAVIHLGACSSTTEQDAEYVLQNNYQYSKAVAEWALKNRSRFIYASSAATYGDGSQGFNDDEATLGQLLPLNVYGYSKHLFDEWAQAKGILSLAAGLKFFNVFGPNEYHKDEMRSVVVKAYEQIRSTGSVQLFKSYNAKYADGEQRRDFVSVQDCCEVMAWLLEHKKSNGLFNLGTGKSRSWNDLVKSIFAALKLPPKIEYIEMPEILRGKYQYFTEARMEKLAAAGCPFRFRTLEESVCDYVTNYLGKEDPYI